MAGNKMLPGLLSSPLAGGQVFSCPVDRFNVEGYLEVSTTLC
jgi:hypothetical protein